MPARLVDGFVPQDDQDAVVRLRPSDWGNTLSGEALAERAAADVERHPPSLRLLSGPFAGGPLWPDPSFWLPEVERLVRTVAAFHERRLSPDERGDVRQAAERLEQAVRVAPDDPIALFRLAWCLYLLGEDDARAVRLFRDAARYDRAPTHGNDVTNGIVRKLAEEFPDVALVDAEAAVCAHCPDGLVGYELMLDSCHVHAAARPMLLDEFVPTLLRLGDRVRARKLATPAR
jgi:tetratricopeptide (TPR) repeat protein